VENPEIATTLDQVADLLEIQGANPFRVRAYRNAARTVKMHAVPMRRLLAEGTDLTELPGIGKEMAGHVAELATTGDLSLLDRLDEEVPRSLIEIVALSGVGPKKAARFWKELGIETVGELRAAAQAGRVAALEGFGEASQEKILRAIERRRTVGTDRPLLAHAERRIAPLLDYLRAAKQVQRLEVAGSYRRRLETVGDVDLLAVARQAQPVMERFTSYPGAARVVISGPTRGRIALESASPTGGLEVDLRIVPRKSYGAAMVYFTGSKEHNIKLRQRAIERGLRLSEYGLFHEQEGSEAAQAEGGERDPWAGEMIAGREETQVYKALDLPWIPPELREDRGELAAAAAGELPELIEPGDIRGDLQMHSDWSDGRNSIAEMVVECVRRGYDYLALTDHSPALAMTGGLDARRLRRQWREIATIQEHVPLRILRAQEVDVLADGALDQTDEILAELDLVVAAIHSRLQLSAGEQTKRILKALEHPAVNILAHPTARLIGRRRPISFDLDEVLHCARENRVAMELNCLPHRLDLKDSHLIRARELGVKVVISTDAHAVADLEMMRFGVDQARRAWLRKRDVLNTLPVEELSGWFARS
jgi:DNA polymerase (family 10)